MRRDIRLSNPYSFLQVKNKLDDDWLKYSKDCFYYQAGEKMVFPLIDRVTYYARPDSILVNLRDLRIFLSLKTKLLNKVR